MTITGKTVPGGIWLSPNPQRPQPVVGHPNFSEEPANGGNWQTACRVTTPTAGTVHEYACDWKREGVPDGPVQLSFDVYDTAGNVNLAPNGIHQGILQQL